MADLTDPTDARQQWRTGVSKLISYRHLGTWAEARDRHHADGWLNLRSDLRGPAGLLAAPLGIAMLGTAGINVDAIAVVSPTRIDVNLFEPATDVQRVRFEGSVVREGHSQMFTESRLVDDDDPTRVIGTGGTHWAVSGPNPGFEYVDNGPGVPDTPDLAPLHEVFGARRRADGNLEIPELTDEIGHNGLHQGPFQVVSEAAAMMAAEDALGTDRFWIEHQGTSIVARGIGAPFVTGAEVLRVADGAATVRVEVRAAGADDRVCSVSLCRFRLA